MQTKLVLLISLLSNIYSQDICIFDDKILTIILMNERHPKKEIGYKYLISFNNKVEAEKVRDVIPKYFIDKRTIDCENLDKCKIIVENLWGNNIVNLDLGAFQINSYFHKLPIIDYFQYHSSYYFACDYVKSITDKKGYTWEAIASYHSQTPIYNEKYKFKLMKNLKILDQL